MKALVLILAALAVLALAGLGGLFWLAQKSKTGTPPGIVDGMLAPCPDSPNCVVSEDHADAAHRVDPLPAGSWDAIPDAVRDLGGRVRETGDDYIVATFSSDLFGFVDDVEFRRSEAGVHVRSASRVGYGDGGVNGKRVAALRAALGA